MPTTQQRRQAETMAGCGIPHADIARAIGVAPMTLRKHYRDELDLGHVKATAKVAANLFRTASGTGPKAVTAAIFWLKCRAGWSEYAPPPVAGKKEQARFDAQHPDESTELGRILARCAKRQH
jgi:hypothetical protein